MTLSIARELAAVALLAMASLLTAQTSAETPSLREHQGGEVSYPSPTIPPPPEDPALS